MLALIHSSERWRTEQVMTSNEKKKRKKIRKRTTAIIIMRMRMRVRVYENMNSAVVHTHATQRWFRNFKIPMGSRCGCNGSIYLITRALRERMQWSPPSVSIAANQNRTVTHFVLIHLWEGGRKKKSQIIWAVDDNSSGSSSSINRKLVGSICRSRSQNAYDILRKAKSKLQTLMRVCLQKRWSEMHSQSNERTRDDA